MYVGQSVSVAQRIAQHRQSKDWWRHVVSIRIERRNSADDLDAAEQAAIANEAPIYNIKRPANALPPMEAPEHGDSLAGLYFHTFYDCEHCGRKHIQRQGCVTRQIDETRLMVEYFSWFDGYSTGQQIVGFDDVDGATWYDRASDMHAAYDATGIALRKCDDNQDRATRQERRVAS